jgi:acyl carrier protein
MSSIDMETYTYIDDAQPIMQLGLDSLALADLRSSINAKFQIDFANYINVRLSNSA